MAINQLKAGALLSYLVLGVSNIVGLLYTPYMLRMMGKSEYGLYALVGSVIAYLTILDFGFGNAIIRYTAKFRAEGKLEEQNSMFGLFIILYSIIGLLSFLIGLVLYFNVEYLFGETMSLDELGKAKIMMLLMVFNIAFTFPLSIFGSIISAYENFVFVKVVALSRIILNTLIMILLLEIGYRAIGMVVLATILNLLTLAINFWYCKSKIKIKVSFKNMQLGLLKEISIYSFYIFLIIIIDKVYWSTGQFILGMYIGTAAVAVFAVAIQFQGMFMGMSLAISGVFLPKVTRMITKLNNEVEISNLFIRTGRIQFIIIAFILSGFLLFGKQFIVLWAGPDYREAYSITVLFFIALSIPLIQTLGMTILQARNQMKFRSWLYFFMAIVSLIMQFILVKKYGGIGVAYAISGALILGNVFIMNIYYHKKQALNMIKFWTEILKMAVVPFVIAVITHLSLMNFNLNTPVKLFYGIVIYSVIYLPLFWFISMNSYERELILNPIRRLTLKKINTKN
ncbi:Membrane protein involved in the export of O-antigen and teichoic acid [Maribacter sedimenticola]|uniref:Membrane protein involved in the export of O-antigen and teichoic acid n=1 Tax=Maribacter sedimenticola TaxID=228956 RepID=A0ABY1SJW9_9FLAO|nr:oligosaccharide flippase family protein [Maribacter sedimenticola]SNR66993.1 Membrane protein involved in the export of O-antigen and teichoic acid [Maribacter sedimenticola]